jgi:hypothetical protein
MTDDKEIDVRSLELNEIAIKKRDHLFAQMKAKAMTKIIVDFAGSGDSGQIEDVSWEGLHKDTVKLEEMTIDPLESYESRGTQFNATTRKWEPMYDTKTYNNMKELAEDVTYAVLEATDLDWYNNDGGQGNVTFWITPEGKDTVYVDIGVNYTQTTSYEFEMEA